MDVGAIFRPLVYVLVAVVAYFFGRRLSSVFRKKWMNYALVLVLTSALAFIFWTTLAEELESQSLLFSMSKPGLAVRLFLVLTAPALYGVFKGRPLPPPKDNGGS